VQKVTTELWVVDKGLRRFEGDVLEYKRQLKKSLGL